MAKYVPDITTDRWVIIAEGRTKRPSDQKPIPVNTNKICVFCPGFERIPGEEVYRIGEGKPYERGWKVRVIKNKYPITDFHEVIVHSPNHDLELDQMPLLDVEAVIRAYRQRFLANSEHGHVIIFNNVGEAAGASITHPHSQLVVVPKQINIDTLGLEPVVNVVADNKFFTVFCPDFSQWPFEVWIAPKITGKFFGDIGDLEIKDLAVVLQDTIRRMLKHLSGSSHEHPGVPMVQFKHEPAYNFYIHHGNNWYIRIVPRLVHRAGFELGTGIQVNIIDPADAAESLRQEAEEK